MQDPRLPVRKISREALPLRPVPYLPASPGLAPHDEGGRHAAWQRSNLTLRQFLYWLEESLHPDLPLSQNVFLYALPPSLAPFIGTAWEQFSDAADACRARLDIEDGVPKLSFGHPPEPLVLLDLPLPAGTADDEVAEEIFNGVDPLWTSFRPGESQVRHLLARMPDERCYWLFTAGHLVADTRSMAIMRGRMVDVMSALAADRPAPPLHLPSFEAACRADRDSDLERGKYDSRVSWQEIIGGEVPPFRTFGIDERTGQVCRIRAKPTLPPARVDALFETIRRPEVFSRSIDASMANFFTALTALWIWRHGGLREVLFGIPLHGRGPGEGDLFGFKSEVLPLRLELDPDRPFSELVTQVHERMRNTLRYRGTTINNPAQRPVIHAQSNYLYERDWRERTTDRLRRVDLPRHSAAPESIHFLQYNDPENPAGMLFVLTLHSMTGRYTDESRLGIGYVNALDALIDNPLLRLRDVPFNDPVHDRFFDTMEAPAQPATTLNWLSAWAARRSTDETPALVHENAVDGEGLWTHGRLREEAARWAAFLRAQGVGHGDRVLAWTPSSNSLAAAVLGLFACEATYVPLHPSITADQVLITATRLGARFALTDPSRSGTLAGQPLRTITLLPGSVADVRPGLLQDPAPQARAHIFHTSGTTGTPKAIGVSHESLATFTRSWIGATGMNTGEVLCHFYATTFDPWLSALLPTLILDGTCVIADPEHPPAGEALRALLERWQVTTLCTPTAYFHAASALSVPVEVRRWIVGGEALAADRAMAFLHRTGSTRLLNAYGPTETTVWASVHAVNDNDIQTVPIGRPMPTCGFRVADEFGTRTPFGVPGELWICGPQLAEGYIGQPALTEASFAANGGRRWYRTGDLVRWRKDGDLDFLGRLDRQVKIRGHRVEPGEIEAALRSIHPIREAVVVPVDTARGVGLCGYFRTENPAEVPADAVIRSALLKTLPEYKVPRWLLHLPTFPLNASGKIDHSRLPTPSTEARRVIDDYLPSLTLWDLRILFEDVLGIPRIGVDENFFELGGDSLRLVALIAAIEQRFNRSLDPMQIMEHPTIGALAPLLETRRADQAARVITLTQGVAEPVFCIPGAGGIGVEFYPLSRRLGAEQPLVVLRAAGTSGYEHPHASARALIGEHVEQILEWRARHQATRPVLLMGYSLGGIFAWEVATCLASRGIAVGCVFLIDSHVATKAARKRLGTSRKSLRTRLRGLWSEDPGKTERRALAAELDRNLRQGTIMDAAKLGRYNLLSQVALFAQIESRPATSRTVYLLASNGDRRQHAELWRALARQLEIHEIPGDHTGDRSIVREPNVARTAEVVAGTLRSVLAGD